MSSSYRQTIEELKKIKKVQGGNLQNQQKPPLDPFEGSSPGPPEKSAQGEHTWQDFDPDLEPADFKIEETVGGISGRSVREDVAGTIGFFIPWERLKEGPTSLVEDAGEWEVSELTIPSQVEAGFVDVWSLGSRRCGVGFRLRFLRCERATDLMEGPDPMEGPEDAV